jgi:hypothetical protein
LLRVRLLNEHEHRIRRDTIRHHLELADAGLLVGGDVEVSGYETIRSDGHRAVIVRPSVLHMPVDDIRDAHQWVIGGGLNVVTVSRALRYAVEPEAEGLIRLPAFQENRSEQQGRLRVFRMPRCGREDFHVVGEIREEDLAGGKHEHITDERSVYGSVGSARNCVQAMPIPFKERGRRSSETRTRKHENLAVRLKGRRTIGNIVRSRELRTSRPFPVG